MKFGLYKTENVVTNEPLKKVSFLRMFLYLLESSLFGVVLACVYVAMPLAIVVWPIAVFYVIASFIATFVSLPYLLFVALPLTLFFYNRRKDNLLVWMGCFFLISWVYSFALVYFSASSGIEVSGFLPIHGALTGFFMWIKLFGYRFKSKNRDPKF